ncbi:caspase family protein [Bosea sp. (in: a-proteobacteria)]|uniref:caspase family protein n=1 Tax=Bosea sp. (in: a-proteobacteria) TaxID=1871050 RepID=UPI002736A216|nr:caspase family protein [Bosea sp. (in: a-proteobacteria)]MDP3410981.1 caspase family protein [Bosea sp. (in: a-proteobacteria)]
MILAAGLRVVIGCALLMLALPAAASERRVALVIGNSSYANAPVLPNTVNDARDMAASLRKVGFEVVDGVDLDKRGMDQAVTRFARLAQDADAVMFYYAGHGLQFNGENYLVPIEARVEDEIGVQYETTRLNDVVTALNFSRGVKIMVLDACRNNPFVGQLAKRQATRGFAVGSGLAPVARAQGMVIAYATQANDVAADGAGRNSPFTAALVREIEQPGLEVATMFRRVQKSVYDATNGRQTPELSLSLLGDFYLNREETDSDVWRRIRVNEDPAVYHDFIARYPTSFFTIDARTRLDLIERRAGEAKEREALAREFAARERALLDRVERAEKVRQQAAIDLARRDGEGAQGAAPAVAARPAGALVGTVRPVPLPGQSGQARAERERLAEEVVRRERELASLETEKRRLADERVLLEQAMAARMGSLTMSPPDQPSLSRLAPPSVERSLTERTAAPPPAIAAPSAARPQAVRAQNARPSAAACSEILLRAQLGELTAQAKEQLLLCR